MERLVYLAVGFVMGAIVGLTATGEAEAPARRDYADVQCKGNGPDGYRRCRIDFERPAKKVAVDVYIGGEFDIGMIWRPEPGQWKRVYR
jgi:hypothetical protein